MWLLHTRELNLASPSGPPDRLWSGFLWDMRHSERKTAFRCKLDPKVQSEQGEDAGEGRGGAQFSTTGPPSESLGPTLCKCEESSAISQVSETQPLSMASEPLRAEGDTQRNFTTQGYPSKGPNESIGLSKERQNQSRVAQSPHSEKLCGAFVLMMDLKGGATLHVESEGGLHRGN